MKKIPVILWTVLLNVWCVAADETSASLPAVTLSNQTVSATTINTLDPTAKKKLNELLHSPDTYNNVLQGLLQPQLGKTNALLSIISDLNIKFKAFDNTSSGGKTGLGFEYAYDKSFVGSVLRTNDDAPLDLSLNFHARGNVAFNKNINPNDFLDTGISFELFQSVGGVEPRLYQADAITANRKALFNATTITNTVREEIDADPRWKEWQDIVKRALRNQYFYDVAANVSLESDQTFSQKQLAYGLQVGGVIRAWNDDSPLARFNVFDYPFAVLRLLTGGDRLWHPSGQTLPAVLAGIDLVDPYDNSSRLAVDPDRKSFPRFRGEVAFKTRVARLMEKDLWFSASYRYFKEIGASSLIQAAELDEQHFFAASLELLGGFSLDYSNGKLPFDQRNEQVFALGYTLKF